MTVIEAIIRSFKNLGGKAHYSDLYIEYENVIGHGITSGQKAGIRKCIEMHSSVSDNFRGNDLFYSVDGKGKGYWGLR